MIVWQGEKETCVINHLFILHDTKVAFRIANGSVDADGETVDWKILYQHYDEKSVAEVYEQLVVRMLETDKWLVFNNEVKDSWPDKDLLRKIS